MFTEIESWTYEGKEPGVYTFFEALELSQLTNKKIRLSSETQMKLLGANVFGKRQINVDEKGDISMSVSVCFGTDRERVMFPWTEVRRAIAEGKQIHPQCPNPYKYLTKLVCI